MQRSYHVEVYSLCLPFWEIGVKRTCGPRKSSTPPMNTPVTNALPTSCLHYNARNSAALNFLRTMQCAGSPLPDLFTFFYFMLLGCFRD
ncbi:hypothetical protein EVAR_44276_1 [Eumeta japonica]|uniref:Uncharacterized protein n=1 Tax=Eumeta variegata TaxID=151549 RepID=A0A4C1WT57_EUMVA|nr:hypothetical protein EVAR_44276_1 [Eumeta japonica]